MKYKYVAYIRKSSESKEKQVLSIPSQKRELQEKFPDLDITEWIDEEKSVFKPYNRPKFADMIERVIKGEIYGIVAWHPDRLSRNEIDAGAVTFAARTGVLKDLRFVSYNFINSPEGIKQLQDELVDSQYSSAKLSVNVKRGLGDKLKMGRMPVMAPIGYFNTKLAERGENKINVDKERFDLVRKMWDLMLTGSYSVPQVRDIATKEWGLLTPKRKKRGGGPVAYTSAYNIFSNIFYTGHFKYGGQIYKGDHESMITLAEFDRVQTLIGARGNPRPKTHTFAYGCGTFTCGECGYSLTSIEKIKYIKTEQKTKEYVFYLCGNRGKVTTCSQDYNVNEVEIEKQLKEELIKYTIDPEFLHWALEVMKDNEVMGMLTEKDIKENVAKTLENKQEELKRLIQMATKGFISDEEFKQSRAELDEVILSLKSQLEEVESEKNENLMKLTEKAFIFSTYALMVLENGDKKTKNEIVKSFGLNRTIKDKKVSIVANEWYNQVRLGSLSLRKILARAEPGISCKQTIVSDFPNIRSVLRGLVDDIRTGFESRNDATVYIPTFYPTLETTT